MLTNLESNDAFLNGFLDILFGLANDWLTDKKVYPQTLNFSETKNVIVTNSYIIQEYLDRDFIRIPDNKAQRLGKEQLHKIFKLRYSTSLITQSQLISSLKDKGLTYMCDLRRRNVKGCILGLELRQDYQNDYEDVDDDDDHISPVSISSLSIQSNPVKKV